MLNDWSKEGATDEWQCRGDKQGTPKLLGQVKDSELQWKTKEVKQRCRQMSKSKKYSFWPQRGKQVGPEQVPIEKGHWGGTAHPKPLQPSGATGPSSGLETRLPQSSIPGKLLPPSCPQSSLQGRATVAREAGQQWAPQSNLHENQTRKAHSSAGGLLD